MARLEFFFDCSSPWTYLAFHKAMRGALVAHDHGCLPAYARAVFEAYWRDLEDPSQDETLERIVARVGLEAREFFENIRRPEYKDRLRANTDELIRRGGFGSPTFFVNGEDMYFGNDRTLVRAALLAPAAGAARPGSVE